MNSETTIALATTAAALAASQKVLGPTLLIIGQDLQRLYEYGRDNILIKAARKVVEETEPQVANLRVAKAVFESGSFTKEEICAEYFGGILASCRSPDGNDDSALPLLETIKGLSSRQLHLHYILYRCFNEWMLGQGKRVNVCLGADLLKVKLTFHYNDFVRLGIHPQTDLPIIFKAGLLSTYSHTAKGFQDQPEKTITVVEVTPSSLGVMLYAVAHNRFNWWPNFSIMKFGELEAVEVVSRYYETADLLLREASAKKEVDEKH